MNVLITGGAGFIGTHLSRRLLQEGCKVAVFDNFHPQIHGGEGKLASDLVADVELIVGDVRDSDALHRTLLERDVVVHFAAETGTGQSMYEVKRYQEANIGGTAVLMDFLTNDRRSRVSKVVVASSRAIYGEGKYACPDHGVEYPEMRIADDMKGGQYEPVCPVCGRACSALPTDEAARMQPTSFYGLTKQVQEQMVLLYARALDLSAYALRYQNVYGPGQSLKNPYTGILAIFSNLARREQPINVFEDGLESRDFVHVADVVEGTWLAMRPDARGIDSINIGSGVPTSVLMVAEAVIRELGSRSPIRITGEFRIGDIRHNYADLRRAEQVLSFVPQWEFADGIRDFLQWSLAEPLEDIGYEASIATMKEAGLHYQPS